MGLSLWQLSALVGMVNLLPRMPALDLPNAKLHSGQLSRFDGLDLLVNVRACRLCTARGWSVLCRASLHYGQQQQG
jgi:hypothetical protein